MMHLSQYTSVSAISINITVNISVTTGTRSSTSGISTRSSGSMRIAVVDTVIQ